MAGVGGGEGDNHLFSFCRRLVLRQMGARSRATPLRKALSHVVQQKMDVASGLLCGSTVKPNTPIDSPGNPNYTS